jgi:hypothetical protein
MNRELTAKEQEMVLAAVHQFCEDLLQDHCTICHRPLTSKRQGGRAVYGEPCGHRMYQGRAK